VVEEEEVVEVEVVVGEGRVVDASVREFFK
jgi:hypothetical protein